MNASQILAVEGRPEPTLFESFQLKSRNSHFKPTTLPAQPAELDERDCKKPRHSGLPTFGDRLSAVAGDFTPEFSCRLLLFLRVRVMQVHVPVRRGMGMTTRSAYQGLPPFSPDLRRKCPVSPALCHQQLPPQGSDQVPGWVTALEGMPNRMPFTSPCRHAAHRERTCKTDGSSYPGPHKDTAALHESTLVRLQALESEVKQLPASERSVSPAPSAGVAPNRVKDGAGRHPARNLEVFFQQSEELQVWYGGVLMPESPKLKLNSHRF